MIDSVYLDLSRNGYWPMVRVSAFMVQTARDFKSAHWHEIVGMADGYSDRVPEDTELHDTLDRALELAGNPALCWIASHDYKAPQWIENPAYRAWIDRWNTLSTATERLKVMAEGGMPEMGHWVPQQGILVGFVERTAHHIRFCG